MARPAPANLQTTGTQMAIAVGVLLATSAIALAIGSLAEVPEQGENEVQEFLGGGAGFGALIAVAATLFLGWAFTGVPLFARRVRWRLPLHFWIAIAALAAAVLHGIGLMALGDLRGWLSGWLAVAALVGLWVTGWKRRDLVAAWGRLPWRWLHWELAAATLLLSLEHWWIIEVTKNA